MKNKIRIITGFALLLPFVSLSDINITAPSQDGGWAILYNPTTGSVYNEVQFDAAGEATLDTTGINGISANWAIDLTYDSSKSAQSRIYWPTTEGGSTYTPTQTGWVPGDIQDITAVTGETIGRSYNTNNMAKRTMSVTYEGNTGATTPLTGFNNNTYQLDATLLLYRPALDVFSEVTSNPHIKLWDPDTLGLGYTYSTNGTAPVTGLTQIEITGPGFLANYLGAWNGAETAYEVYLTVADNPGDTAYWSTSNANGGSDDGVVSELSGDITFTATATNSITLSEGVPYYVWMEQATIYDDASGTLTVASDCPCALDLTEPELYTIPEPGVLVMLLGGAGVLMISRRLTMGF